MKKTKGLQVVTPHLMDSHRAEMKDQQNVDAVADWVPDQTMQSIAASEKVARLDLAKANNLSLNADLKAGQVLTIPSAVAPKAPVKTITTPPTKAATKSTPSASAPAPAPTFAPLKLVPLTGTKSAAVTPADKK